jgi:hypothetical protein
MSLKNIRPMPDLNELRSALRYEPQTGFFYCRKTGVQVDRRTGGTCRATVCFKGKGYLAHRLAWFYFHGVPPKHTIDHINEIPDDNRIENLQDVPHRENIRLHWQRVKVAKQLRAAA